MNKQTISNVKVKAVKINPDLSDPKKIRGYDLFNEPYANIALMASKKSGKSTVIFNALKKCVGPLTKVIIFSPTASMDATYRAMFDMLKKKRINYEVYPHFQDVIPDMMESLIEKAEIESEESETEPPIEINGLLFDDPEVKNEVSVSVRKDKKLSPELILVFDDLASDMKNPMIEKILIKNRHFKMKCFIAIHNLVNLTPSSIRNLDVCIVFKGQSPDKINELAAKLGLNFEQDTKGKSYLNTIYRDATEGRYNFLYVDKGNNNYRKNFNEQYNI